MKQLKDQYCSLLEENGRLDARIHAATLNAQSEQDVLASEVKRREEAVEKAKFDIMNLQEEKSKLLEKVNKDIVIQHV